MDILQNLMQSPIYNISLSSKELFHSNFLAWLCEMYPKEMGSVFAEFLGLTDEIQIDVSSVERETKNIDLQFSLKSGEKVIIENKVKSLPYKAQLTEYAEKYIGEENVNYILLSLSEPEHLFKSKKEKVIECELSNGGLAIWKYLSYEQLSAALAKKLKSITDTYHRAMVIDYVDLLKSLIEITKLAEVDENDLLNFQSDNIHAALSEIRLDGFYLKKKGEHIINLIREKLNFENTKIHYALKAQSEKFKVGEIVFNSTMVRGKNVVLMYYKVSEEVVYALEIDGQNYIVGCIFLIKSLKRVDELWAGFVKNEKKLFSLARANHIEINKTGRDKEKGYKKFTEYHRYWSIPLKKKDGPFFTVKEIVEHMVKDFYEIVRM